MKKNLKKEQKTHSGPSGRAWKFPMEQDLNGLIGVVPEPLFLPVLPEQLAPADLDLLSGPDAEAVVAVGGDPDLKED